MDAETDLLILASDGIWKVQFLLPPYLISLPSSLTNGFTNAPSFPFQVISNQEAVDIVKKIKDPQKAAKQLVAEALNKESKDDISCIVVRF